MRTTPGVADVAAVDPEREEAPPRRGVSTVLILTVALTFLLRLALAGKESYWLDELYSTYLYATQPRSLVAAVSSLAETSIHPPLYQILLYGWVVLFGDTEAATRTLSNLLVTLSIVGLHRMVTRLHGRPAADAVAILFAISYAVTFYGLETRSYALTLALSVASSYLLVRCFEPLLLDRIPGRPGWSVGASAGHRNRGGWVLPRRWLAGLSMANLLLLLTHYYNLFFWGTQALFGILAVLLLVPAGRRLREAGRLAAIYVAQLVTFGLLWGRVTWASYANFRGEYAVDETVTATPLAMVSELITPNLRFGVVPSTVVLLVALGVVALGGARRRRDELAATTAPGDERAATFGFGAVYAAAMIAGPAIFAFLAFLVLQEERFFDRYLIYVVPSVVVVLVLAAREVARAGRSWAASRAPDDLAVRLPDAASLAALLLVPAVLPGFVDAVTYEKVDWRGVAADVAAVTGSDPGSSYFVYETASRTTPVLDHYLERLGSDTLVAATMRRIDERHGRFPFETDERIGQHDYVMVVFTHHRPFHFPRTLERLEASLDVHHRQLDEEGLGYVIFEVPNGS